MAYIVQPINQQAKITPYSQRLFQFNQSDSRIYISRVTNSLLGGLTLGDRIDSTTYILQEDAILDGFQTTHSLSGNILYVTVEPGVLIQDLTLLTFPDSTELSLDLSSYDDSGTIILSCMYQYAETITSNPAVLKLSCQALTEEPNCTLVPDSWVTLKDRIVVTTFSFLKVGDTVTEVINHCPDPVVDSIIDPHTIYICSKAYQIGAPAKLYKNFKAILDTYSFDSTTIDGGSGTVDSSAFIISTSLILYVSTAGNDLSGTGTVSAPFATVFKAMDYLKDKWINSDVTVTISVAEGIYTSSFELDINHPCGNRIHIICPALGTKTYTSIQTVGTLGDPGGGQYKYKDLILNVNNVTDITVGDYAGIITATGGTNPYALLGSYEIINVDSPNSRITVRWYVPLSPDNTGNNPSGSVSGSIRIHKTIFRFNSCNGFNIHDYSGLNISNAIIVGNFSAYTGILVDRNSIFDATYFSSVKFSKGILADNNSYANPGEYAIYNNNIDGLCCDHNSHIDSSIPLVSNCYNSGINCINQGYIYIAITNIANCGSGIYAAYKGIIFAQKISSLAITPTKFYITRCSYGIYSQYEGLVYADGCNADYNSNGFYASYAGTLYIRHCGATYNYYGIYAAYGGIIYADALGVGVSSICNYNTFGFYALAGSKIYAQWSTASRNNICGYLALEHSYIDAKVSRAEYNGAGGVLYIGGYQCYYGSVLYADASQANNNTGYGYKIAHSSVLRADNSGVIASYNSSAGVLIHFGSSAYLTSSRAFNNTGNGFIVSDGSNMRAVGLESYNHTVSTNDAGCGLYAKTGSAIAGSSFNCHNNVYGLKASINSTLTTGTDSYISALNTNTYSIYAWDASIIYSSAGWSGLTNSTPAVNVEGNTMSIITTS